MAPVKDSPRKKRHRSGWWFDIFEEMERMDSMMEDMLHKAMKMPRADEGPLPFVYGFSMSVGPDGRAVIREFGPNLVSEGLYDVGITGKDWIDETKANVARGH